MLEQGLKAHCGSRSDGLGWGEILDLDKKRLVLWTFLEVE